MDAAEHLVLGFATALTPTNLLACFAGALLGTAIGVLPGLGPLTTIALLLPFTFSLPPTAAVIMLAGIYYGAQYGGSVTAILINLPGEPSSTITCLDGHAMARSGRARLALAVAAIGSFVGGTVGTALLAALAVPLASVAARFTAADYAALMLCGLVAAIVIANGSVPKAILAMTRCRPLARRSGHRRRHGSGAIHVGRAGTVRRHRLHASGNWHVRPCGYHPRTRIAEPPSSTCPPLSNGCGHSRANRDARPWRQREARARFVSWRSAWRRAADRVVCVLCRREESRLGRASGWIRRHRRCRRSGIRQQRCRADFVHSPAHAGVALQRHHGAPAGRLDCAWNPTWPCVRLARAGIVLGTRRQHVDWGTSCCSR